MKKLDGYHLSQKTYFSHNSASSTISRRPKEFSLNKVIYLAFNHIYASTGKFTTLARLEIFPFRYPSYLCLNPVVL